MQTIEARTAAVPRDTAADDVDAALTGHFWAAVDATALSAEHFPAAVPPADEGTIHTLILYEQVPGMHLEGNSESLPGCITPK